MSPRTDQSIPTSACWRIRSGQIALDRPIVVGILNVTPDSFSDGGKYASIDDAVARVELMVSEGADAIDVGGESTRPLGASAVSVGEELRRVVPIVRTIRDRFSELPICVDTTKSEVADAGLGEGANVINDVSGFRIDPRMREIAAVAGAGVVLMHSRGSVEEMGTYQHAQYGLDPVGEIVAELSTTLTKALSGGIPRDAIVLDPGIGFAKRSPHSVATLAALDRLLALGCPLMIGVSRKRFVGELSHVAEPSHRVAGTVGANVVGLMLGARLFRVHDVAPNRQALDVAWGILNADRVGSVGDQ